MLDGAGVEVVGSCEVSMVLGGGLVSVSKLGVAVGWALSSMSTGSSCELTPARRQDQHAGGDC